MGDRRRDLRSWLGGIPRGAARSLLARDPGAAARAIEELGRCAPLDEWLEPPLPDDVVFVALLDDETEPQELIAFIARANRRARELGVRVVMIIDAAGARDAELYGAFWFDSGEDEPLRGHPHPESPAEQLLARAISRDPDLAPLFELNAAVTTAFDREIFVDLVWRPGSLAVEIDGWSTHGTRAAFARDRQRDFELALAGYTVLRLTHEEVITELDRALEKIRALVRARKPV